MKNLLTFFAAGLLVGCATTSSGSIWNDETVTRLSEGMSKTEVSELFGDPTKKETRSGGKEIWIFRRASDESGMGDKYVSVVTLGTMGGSNATRVDALSIMFSEGAVEKFKYEEHADNAKVEAGGFD